MADALNTRQLRLRKRREDRDPVFLAQQLDAWHRYASKPSSKIKIQARSKLRQLVHTGKVKRGDCEACGKPNAHAHHEDYSKPLDVRWLCAKCHGLEHRAKRASVSAEG